ncbi:SDR family oxidoreductase [Candidatus Poribacteria bacterium]|nr:SDR family oxidoreductase [Candidatus Poribacteria bacterium]
MRFQGKSVIVTGGASGIGKATAKQFASEGANVVIADINLDGQAVAEEIGQETQTEIFFVQADVSKAGDADHLIQETLRQHSQLDILHNNAGILVVGDVTTISEADWDRCIDINLKSVYLVSRYAIPAMQQTGGGVIINTASTAGMSGGSGYSVYGASKAAIILLTQCMALDFAKHNIRVNAVCPGPTATPMIVSSDADRQSTLDRWAAELPIGRAGEPEDTAKAVAYLASDDASFVTGSAFVVDGGRLLTGIGQRIAIDV